MGDHASIHWLARRQRLGSAGRHEPSPHHQRCPVLVALAGCGTFPKTTVHSRDAAGLPDSLAILPFTDQATGGRVDKTFNDLCENRLGLY